MSRIDEKIRVGITQGDCNGISNEVIIKTLMDARIYELCTPILYGSSKVASYHRKVMDVVDFNFNTIKNANEAHSKRANLVNCYDKEVKIEMGKVSQAAGELSVVAMETAVEDLRKNNIDVLVTAPINKYSIQSQNFNYPGHTEFLADKFKVENHLMLMVSDVCKIGIATNHIAVKDISANLTTERIYNKIKVMNNTLIRDFAVRMPKIAVLSLNPHKGDKGVIGTEEENVIIPAINKAYGEKVLVYGPYAADGFFRDGNYSKFDAVLAMYHDQGLIPFKMMAFENGVNYTAGLPVIRTSPDHGTGFEIAGKNVASPCSFRSALFLACAIFKNRSAYDSDSANPLKSQYIEKENQTAKQ